MIIWSRFDKSAIYLPAHNYLRFALYPESNWESREQICIKRNKSKRTECRMCTWQEESNPWMISFSSGLLDIIQIIKKSECYNNPHKPWNHEMGTKDKQTLLKSWDGSITQRHSVSPTMNFNKSWQIALCGNACQGICTKLNVNTC